MACYHPISAWQDLKSGRYVFTEDRRLDLGPRIERPCRQCIGCRIAYSSEWALRAMHESSQHDISCFVTLTHSDECFPESQADWRRANVLFVKRVRRSSSVPVRTYGCMELGDRTRRPHSHFLVFGRDFSRDAPVGTGEVGSTVYESSELSALWPHGHSSVGDLTAQSAGYVARYAMKRQTNRGELVAELVAHPLTGELIPFHPALPIGRSQGLGRAWFDQFGPQQAGQGAVIMHGGVRVPLPDYYAKLARKRWPTLGADAECAAQERGLRTVGDRTPERLGVREEVKRAQLSTLKRGSM